MPRPARVSPERILAAAAAEFSARGYAGARVDRIARRARVNKAMLYYHFGSKQAIYRAVLREAFAGAAARLETVASGPAEPAHKVEMLVAAFAAFVADHAYFPAIMLREVADGGARLDPATLAALASLPAIVARVMTEGTAPRVLRPVHPVIAYFTMFAPIVLYLGGAPIRKALASRGMVKGADLTPAVFIRQFQESVRLALVASAEPDGKP